MAFTVDNWNTPQTVSGNRTLTTTTPSMMIRWSLTHAVSGGDYEDVTGSRTVEVTIIEDDTPGVTVSGNGVDDHRR